MYLHPQFWMKTNRFWNTIYRFFVTLVTHLLRMSRFIDCWNHCEPTDGCHFRAKTSLPRSRFTWLKCHSLPWDAGACSIGFLPGAGRDLSPLSHFLAAWETSVSRECTEYSAMENKFYQKPQPTAITRTSNREGLGTSHQNYFACFGRGKMEEEGMWEWEVIHDADEGNLNLFLSIPSKQPPPSPSHPPPCACYTATTGIQLQKSIKFGKNVYMLIIHSFSTRAAGSLLII